jgi:hypothetical protein
MFRCGSGSCGSVTNWPLGSRSLYFYRLKNVQKKFNILIKKCYDSQPYHLFDNIVFFSMTKNSPLWNPDPQLNGLSAPDPYR